MLSEFEREQSKLGDLQGKGYGLKGLTQEQAEAVEEKRMEQLSVNFFMMPVSEDDSVPITKEISEKQSGANIFAGGFQKLLSAASLRLKKKKYKEL